MGVIADKIRRAIFGGEVRDSIADGIEVVEQLREDYDNQVINAGNSNAEIVDARGGQTKLKDRLDNFDEQLDKIINLKLLMDVDSTSYKINDIISVDKITRLQNLYMAQFLRSLRKGSPVKIACMGDSMTYVHDT